MYKLYLQPSMKLILGIVLLILIGGGVAMTCWSLWSHDPKAPPLFLGPVYFALAGFICFYFLSLPYQITLNQDGTIEFISLLRRRTVQAHEIRSIQPASAHFGFLVVRTDQRKIRLLAQFDGFHDFLTRLQALHPGVELRGC